MTIQEFVSMRYGMLIQYGLYSMLGRGEWAMNREQIPPSEMYEIAKKFNPEKFDAEEICKLAVDAGMKYIVFTTMHHEGFCLYDTALTDFNSYKMCGRDLVAELVAACRKYGLKIGLYHSLNNWYEQPDAVAALENEKDYDIFIAKTFARFKELVEKFKPVDIIWYDGWWPFNAEGWQAEKMNAMLRKIQPDLLFNGRNCLEGDYATPEQHFDIPKPYRPWETCIPMSDTWCYQNGNVCYKQPYQIIKMLEFAAVNKGNLLLNIAPCPDGAFQDEAVRILKDVGSWLRNGGDEALTNCEPMPFSPMLPEAGDRGDWDPQVDFTCKGNELFLISKYQPKYYALAGLQNKVLRITCNGVDIPFKQTENKFSFDVPVEFQNVVCPVFKVECDSAPVIYRTAGMRIPKVEHPRYDPITPDIKY